MQQENKPKWVQLHLTREALALNGGANVVGMLMMETADKYVIGCMVAPVITPEGITETFSEGTNMINKDFVWRVEQLLRQPELGKSSDDLDSPLFSFDGGLG